jgi:hypothetical protein
MTLFAQVLRLVLRPGTRFPVALAAIAVGLVVAGWLVLQQGTPIAPELRNQGYIGFYISDPEARVDVSVSPSSGPGGEVLPGYRWLSISMLVRSGEGPVWWAVALGEGARFPLATQCQARCQESKRLGSPRTL